VTSNGGKLQQKRPPIVKPKQNTKNPLKKSKSVKTGIKLVLTRKKQEMSIRVMVRT
jgi:hypothetical protein